MINNISIRTRSVLVGILILVAYGVIVSSLTTDKFIVMIFDVISGFAVIGIAILMFSMFKNYKYLSLGYLLLKFIEGVLMMFAGLIFLDTSFQFLREIIYNNIHIYFFIVGTFVFYCLLYKTRVVPRFISIWGITGVFALLISTIFKILNIECFAIDYLTILIITNEIFLSAWLIIKNINKPIYNN